MKKLFPYLIIFSLIIPLNLFPDDLPEEVVWLKETDQGAGFYKIKFSNNEDIIAAHGYENILFLDSETGDEIKRHSNNNEVHFLENDDMFLQLSENNVPYIYNFATLEISDSLQTDGVEINELLITSDERFVVGTVVNGIRIWDLQSGQILRTKYGVWKDSTYSLGYANLQRACSPNEVFVQYYETDTVGFNDKYERLYSTYAEYHWLDITSLEVSHTSPNTRFSRLSPDCKLIAGKSGLADRADYGVLIYDTETGDLIKKLPINGPSLTGLEFTHDGKYLLTSGGGINLWSIQTWQPQFFTGGSINSFSISVSDNYTVGTVSNYILKHDLRTFLPIKDNLPLKIALYPNPAQESITLSGLYSSFYTISLVNSLGQQMGVLYEGYADGEISLSVSGVPAGSYILKIEVEDRIESVGFQIGG